MNNGKVRIYELSRELNLDNKDVQAICEQLHIAVKSHSSTITESEAERIRKAAEKYVASHSSPHRTAPAKHKANTPSPESGNRPHIRKQQQILEIRQHKPRLATSIKQSDAAEPEESKSELMATQFLKGASLQQTQSQKKPTVLNRPTLPISGTTGEQDSAVIPTALEQPSQKVEVPETEPTFADVAPTHPAPLDPIDPNTEARQTLIGPPTKSEADEVKK